jgi:hypothetical protein
MADPKDDEAREKRESAKRFLRAMPPVFKTMETSLGSAMMFRDGQTHLREGIPILSRHVSTLLLAFVQAGLIALVAHDFYSFTNQDFDSMLIMSALNISAVDAAKIVKGGILLGLLPAVPVFFLVNVGWVLLAEKLIYPARPFWKLYSLRSPRTLLAGLMGMVPLRLVAFVRRGLILPDWVIVNSHEPRAALQGAARLGQFYTAARIAMLNSRSEDDREPDVAFAEAIANRGEEIWDGLGSYVWVPIIVVVIFGALILLELFFLPALKIITEPFLTMRLVFLLVAFLAFAKAGLGALIFDAMRKPRIKRTIARITSLEP